ncbi:MAG: hypothetical protein ABIK31_05555 [candidate division WOR-3 bacterium]
MRLAQWWVSCKIESPYFYLALVHIDSLVLLSPPLRQAQKRYEQLYKNASGSRDKDRAEHPMVTKKWEFAEKTL